MSTEAASADDALANLQSRLADLELSKSHNDAAAILQKERGDMLLALRKIMQSLKSDEAGGGASNKELEQLRQENEELKKVNAKQKYRIDHLVHNLRESMEG
mmetsp:Transcript_36758/g.62578  ORF Transcript_36758/g.62578 Transcript_36758/m.62578 type:complete len:102 (-) Transcript_36758:182-487(-)